MVSIDPWMGMAKKPETAARFIVLVAGRIDSYSEAMRFDTRSIHGRDPMTYLAAKARADSILRDEPGVTVYIAEIKYKGHRVQEVWEIF